MSSPFQNAMRVAAVTHDRVMGERFEYRPMRASSDRNAPERVDPDRAIVPDLLAPWVDGSARFHSGPPKSPGVTAEHPGIASTRPAISVDLLRLPYKPKHGDHVVRLATAATYKVAEVQPSSPGFVRLDLNKIRD